MPGITRQSTEENLARRIAALADMHGDAARFQAQAIATTISLLIDISVEEQLRQYTLLRQDIPQEQYNASQEGNITRDHLEEHPDRGSPRQAEEASGGDSPRDRS